MSLGSGHDAVHSRQVVGVVKLAGYAHEVRQVEMPQPQHIDTVHSGNSVHIGHALGGFDHGNHQGALGAGGDLVARRARQVAVVRHPKGGAAPAQRRVARPGHQGARLLGVGHHRHHDAVGTGVQRPGHEVVMKARHPHQRYHAGAVAGSALGLDGLDVDAAVLGVVHQKIRAHGTCHLRHARYKKFKHHGANGHVAVFEALFQGQVSAGRGCGHG